MDYLLFIWFLWTWTWTVIYLTQRGMSQGVPHESGPKPVIVVISSFRSGSSFTGEIFRFPGSIYYFEPFHLFGIVTRTPREGYAMDLFEGLINCDFNYLFNDVHWYDVRFVIKPGVPWMEIMGQRLPAYNKRVPTKLWKEKAETLSNFCKDSTGIVVKTVRLRMDTMAKLFEEGEEKRRKNIHILFNVRDPRAVINSRKKFKWCTERNKCIRSDELCKDVMNDYKVYLEMKSKYPDNFHVQRFEDLIENPDEHSAKLLYAMGLNHTQRVAEFIQSHTSKNAHPVHAYDTHRYSKAIQDRWTWEMNIDRIREVEKDCQQVFKTFNYEVL